MARIFGPQVKSLGHDVSMTAMWGLEGGEVDWGGIPVYPKHVERLGRDVAAAHARHWQADVFFSWCDAFVVDPETLGDLPGSPWFPVDADPVSPHLLPLVKKARWPLVYSKWGLERLQEAGITHARHVPVGVDSNVFRPMDRAEVRRKLSLPADAFVVGMVAANIAGDRKAYPQQLRALAAFRRSHPDAVLCIHSLKDHRMGGVDLPAVCASLGLVVGKDVYFSDQYAYNAGQYGPTSLAMLYNAFDVLLACTQAEGFGVPIVEEAMCGVPAIVGDWSSMSELNFAGLAHPEGEATRIWNKFDTWWWLPRPVVIRDLLEQAYTVTWCGHKRAQLRYKALDYDVEWVMRSNWQPILKEMGAALCPQPEPIRVLEEMTV
jgi:glycosyltransferase involved in cell wall biosynthesis